MSKNSKATISHMKKKKAAAVVADPESESSDSESEALVATKSRKEKSTKKAVVARKPSTPAKRVAVVSADEPSAKKGKSPGLFPPKVWPDIDEITVLTELVKYMAEKGESAPSDIKGFHAFVKGALLGDFDRKQLGRKVRNMKYKYKKSSGKKNLTPHEEKLKKLSKRIWGADEDDAGADDEDDAGADDEDDAGADDDVDVDAGADDDVDAGADDDVDAEEDADAEDEDEDDAEEDDADADDGVKDSSPIVEKEQVADADAETNNVCKMKKKWRFIGKKSIAMGLDADSVNVGLERCSHAVKVEIEEEWEQLHLEEAALFQKQIKLAIKESNCIVQALRSELKL